jgi:phosphomannomutase
MSTSVHSQFPPLNDRPIKNTICLFDVDGTLTPARRVGAPPFLRLAFANSPRSSLRR